jgi:hypothetical protein
MAPLEPGFAKGIRPEPMERPQSPAIGLCIAARWELGLRPGGDCCASARWRRRGA